MRTITQAFPGAATWQLAISGRYFRLMDSIGTVDVNFFRGGQLVYDAHNVPAGFWVIPEKGFDRIDIIVPAANTVTVGISNGEGGFEGSTATIVGVVSVAFSAPQHVVVDNLVSATVTEAGSIATGAAAVEIAAAAATRKGLRIYNDGATDVYLGGAGVTLANGVIKIAPGELWIETEASRASWWAISAIAGSVRVQALT